ncbi:MAG TPA: ammonium transporter [Trebonia sp.]
MSAGDTAWVLVSAGLVMVMLPGLAMFYGGLVSSRGVLVMLQQNIFPLGLVSVLWVLAGFSLAFGPDAGGGVIGNLAAFGLRDLAQGPPAGMHAVVPGLAVPGLAFVAYMMMFAIITPALITGATADRLRFAGYAVVLGLWSLIVYAPVAHWLFSPGGWLARRGAEDWAGGLVVHGSAGAAVIALLLVVGRRRRWSAAASPPHSVPLVVLGAGLLWFGWFGFNGADGLRADGVAAQAVLNTQVAAAAAMLTWLLAERLTDGHATVLGAVTGAVAGLAAITPCAGFVDTWAAIIIGGLAGLICHLALRLKRYLRFDDALDVIPVHFIGGILGTLLLGFFGDKNINPIGANGVFYGGGGALLGKQALATVTVVAFSFAATWIIATAVAKTIGLRVRPADENNLDRVQEAMSAYALSRPAGGLQPVDGDTVRPAMPTTAVGGGMRIIRALVDHEDLDTLRDTLVEAGAVQIVLSEASLYTSTPRTEVFRGQRRKVAFDPRLRLEVTVPKSEVHRVVQAIQRIPGSTYPQIIDASFAAAVGDDGGNGAGERGQGDSSRPAGTPTRPVPRSTADGDWEVLRDSSLRVDPSQRVAGRG